MFLVLIETSGNQNYIFSTNKLKENIGASELTYRAGTQWVIEAVEQVRGASEQIHQVGRLVEEAVDEVKKTLTSQEIRTKLLDTEEWNRPIDPTNDVKVEVVIATSGKALLLTKEKEVAKAIIRYVTHKATRYAPGLDISGVISEKIDWNDHWSNKEEPQGIAQANKQVHREFEVLRSQKPSPLLRFLQLPVVEQCSTSGLPAAQIDRDDDKPISLVARSKRVESVQGLARINKLLENDQRQIRLFNNVNSLQKTFEKDLEWLSVIHADGNGLGEIFLDFWKYVKSNREYIDQYKNFSIALDICTEQAFLKALDVFPPIKDSNDISEIPLIPLILGGDDLTVICDGKYALPFTHKFLQEFEAWTNKAISTEIFDLKEHKQIIPNVTAKALTVGRLSACAGIAITKPHFPFSVAYELSEKLMRSAKQVKERVFTLTDPGANTEKKIPYPCSALDFHVLYDSSDVELDIIRSKLNLDTGCIYLYRRPYVVTQLKQLGDVNVRGIEWAKFHHWSHLEQAVKILTAVDDDGKRKLPNSQMHDLRESLFLGRGGADARYQLIRDRYKQQGIVELAGSEESLFQEEPDNSSIHSTVLLDTIEAADFLDIEE